jgi:transcriptional regulator with XRE-family HTH domain
MGFGDRLRRAWKRSGKTQEKAVEGTDINVRTFQRLMESDGEANPELKTILALSDSLGIQPAKLVQDTPTQPLCQKIPDLREATGMLNHYLNAEQDTRLLALWILTDDDNYLIQYEKLSEEPELAAVLKKILST